MDSLSISVNINMYVYQSANHPVSQQLIKGPTRSVYMSACNMLSLSDIFSPSLKGGSPLYGHPAHLKASPSEHCNTNDNNNVMGDDDDASGSRTYALRAADPLHSRRKTWGCSLAPA